MTCEDLGAIWVATKGALWHGRQHRHGCWVLCLSVRTAGDVSLRQPPQTEPREAVSIWKALARLRAGAEKRSWPCSCVGQKHRLHKTGQSRTQSNPLLWLEKGSGEAECRARSAEKSNYCLLCRNGGLGPWYARSSISLS